MEHPPEGRGGVALLRGQHMRVDVEGGAGLRVPEPLGHDRERRPGREEERRARMPERVERNPAHPGAGDQRLEA